MLDSVPGDWLKWRTLSSVVGNPVGNGERRGGGGLMFWERYRWFRGAYGIGFNTSGGMNLGDLSLSVSDDLYKKSQSWKTNRKEILCFAKAAEWDYVADLKQRAFGCLRLDLELGFSWHRHFHGTVLCEKFDDKRFCGNCGETFGGAFEICIVVVRRDFRAVF